jgi:alanine racemase
MTAVARDCAASGFIPVLNSLEEVEAWATLAHQLERSLPAVIQIDSGMNRLGLSAKDTAIFAERHARTGAFDLRFIKSHWACADVPEHEANKKQLSGFWRLVALLPDAPRSLANSSGIFLGPEYYFSLVRLGAALYGINPNSNLINPMRSVVKLEARVIQLRCVQPGDCSGYGWDYRAQLPARLAAISIGYADGLHRGWRKDGAVFFEGLRLPVVGRVSMDSIVIDATSVAPERLHPDSEVEVIGDCQSVDDVAAAAGTIGYEVLTGLGSRYQWIYLGAEETVPSAVLEDGVQ